jgi:hypothetical protein
LVKKSFLNYINFYSIKGFKLILFDLEQVHLNLVNDNKEINKKINNLNISNDNTTKEYIKLKKQINDNNKIKIN